ncbi:MAG: 4Fe-4S dicluster domain-containing protein [Calditrichaceae bacterium]|nr:4Fe-4S dicluster domain-containing protein [Calditrichaceae bacterium]HES59094.1 NADH dehydrogenase subunit [Caldithrix sp.]
MVNQDILNKIRNAGVIGAGGAGFPTYKKLESRVDHIIANGAECEPLLYKDRETMLQETEAMFRGLKIMQELTGAAKVTIAIKRKNADLENHFKSLLDQYKFNLFIYNDVYPAGDEYVLVYEITGKRIPPGGIPLQVGCVVDNVETIVNIAHAVEKDKPVTEKYITITGAVKNAITTKVPVGVSFNNCITLAGGLTTDKPVALTGGLMMGGLEHDLSLPISKTMGGLIILPEDHYLVQRKSQSRQTYTRIGHGQCDQCSLCTELCPRYILGYPIEPHKVMRTLLMTGEAKERGSLWAQYCCECNVCSLIACPESLDPKNICVDSKQLLKEKGLSFTEAELDRVFRDVHPARDGREVPITTLYQRLGLTPYDRHAHYIETNLNPKEVAIPLNSHIGQPAQPIVKVGDTIRKDDVIGNMENGALGCPVHASIDGKIISVNNDEIKISAS